MRGLSARTRRADDGSALVLVLVLMVVGSLIVIPLLQYAMAVLRANTVLSDKSGRIEAAKAGLRVALADPVRLYDACGESITLPTQQVNGHTVASTCEFVSATTAQSPDELRLGVVPVMVGAVAAVELTGERYVPPDPSSTTDWLGATSLTSETGRIWLPNLPVHALNLRSSVGYEMPSGFPTCRVYFPGTFRDPVVVSGPTFFASGIYYFENSVTIESGASVVVGLGAHQGCTTDQEAAFYAVDAPGTHNINGLGATWVFGHDGRLVVDNSSGDELAVRFNQRYVDRNDAGAAPSADVSIVSVNGALDLDGTTGIALDVPDVLHVPLGLVGVAEPVVATAQGYRPSRLTPAPRPPDPPPTPTVSVRNGAVVVAWTAPPSNGAPIDGYAVVSTSSSHGCTTTDATTCVVTGLTNGTTYRFTVVATNDIGESAPSAQSPAAQPTSSSPAIAIPQRPTGVGVAPRDGGLSVMWTPSTGSAAGNAPILEYTVTAAPSGATCTARAASTCDLSGLVNDVVHQVTVTARNHLGTSPPSNPAVSATPSSASPPLDPPGVDVETAPYEPAAIVDVRLPSSATAVVDIPGYVAVPQGRFVVANAHGHPVRIAGGILAATIEVSDGRADPVAPAQSVEIGYVQTEVQRKFRITSTTSGGNERSVAVVQVNQNGAYAVNSWEVQ